MTHSPSSLARSQPLSKRPWRALSLDPRTLHPPPCCCTWCAQLPVVVDRIRHVNETVQLALTQTGELHLQADSSTVDLGAEYVPLSLTGVPTHGSQRRPPDASSGSVTMLLEGLK
jgi:hypothetical protein